MKENNKKTMKHYNPISILVRSGQYWRVFFTESFTIRPACNHLQRYNPDFRIMSVKYGMFPTNIIPNNTQWVKLTKDEEDELMASIVEDKDTFQPIPDVPDLKAYLLSTYKYRTALNMWYIHAANSGIYPSKSVFRGVKSNPEYIPISLIKKIGICQHLTFVSDADNPYEDKEDILKYYDGRRIEKMVNGQKVEGYLLDSIRISPDKCDI